MSLHKIDANINHYALKNLIHCTDVYNILPLRIIINIYSNSFTCFYKVKGLAYKKCKIYIYKHKICIKNSKERKKKYI